MDAKKGRSAEEKSVVFTPAQESLYENLISGIAKDISRTEGGSLSAAFKISQIYREMLYGVEGYKNIYELAKDKFGMARSTCYHFIDVCSRFGIPEENTLKPEYRDFKISQLKVMLIMPEELIKKVKPDMTVMCLKQILRSWKESQTRLEDDVSGGNPSPGDGESPAYDEGMDGYLKGEDGLYRIPVAQVDDILHIEDKVKDTIQNITKDFKKNFPDKKYHYSISITWR